MSLPHSLNTLRVLVIDTLAQSRAAGVTWGLLAMTIAVAIFCLGVDIVGETPQLPTQPWENAELISRAEAERLKMSPADVRDAGVDVPTGHLRLLFGAIQIPLQRTRTEAVSIVQLVLAGAVADTAGLLLCLIWTASFLPGFLEPSSASVMLAKPLPRPLLLTGKAIGILLAVGLQALLFVSATWITLGLRTQVWDVRYFLAVPILVLHFAVFLSVSTLIAVSTRSAVACVLGTLFIWVICFGVNLARHESARQSEAQRPTAEPLLEITYWLLPKPLDYNLILADSVDAQRHIRPSSDYGFLDDRGGWFPTLSLLTGLLFAGAITAVASRQFKRMDY